jgi:hypothetical protein
LNAILAVGYRVRSSRGVQFRKWVNTVLKEYLVKGFVMNDERLKQADQWDYFDEWLARIRDIRASEKRFYQFATFSSLSSKACRYFHFLELMSLALSFAHNIKTPSSLMSYDSSSLPVRPTSRFRTKEFLFDAGESSI